MIVEIKTITILSLSTRTQQTLTASQTHRVMSQLDSYTCIEICVKKSISMLTLSLISVFLTVYLLKISSKIFDLSTGCVGGDRSQNLTRGFVQL